MKKKNYKTSIFSKLGGIISSIGLFAIMLVIILSSVGDAEKSVNEEGLRVAENAIRRAAVNCYALEGAYPDTYEYLRDNYGVSVNEEQYVIHYNIFAENIMPDITVLEREGNDI